MKNLILLVIIAFSFNAHAEEKEIILENNSYQMNNICSKKKGKFDDEGNYSSSEYIDKKYQFEFISKYNVFENYNRISSSNIEIYTDLHKIEFYKIKAEADNKKVIRIILKEADMKKLYESREVKFVFDLSLFSHKYLTKVYTPDPVYGTTYLDYLSKPLLQPVISITIDRFDFNNELDKCTKKHNDLIEKQNEDNNKPINRIKNFFNF